MKKEKSVGYTIRPLYVYAVGGGVGPITAYETQTPGGKTVGIFNTGDNPNAEADARLGAASPYLLEAAKLGLKALAHSYTPKGENAQYAQAHNALSRSIRKAEGGE